MVGKWNVKWSLFRDMLIFGERIFCCVITRSYLAQCFCNGWKSAFQPAKRSIPDIQLGNFIWPDAPRFCHQPGKICNKIYKTIAIPPVYRHKKYKYDFLGAYSIITLFFAQAWLNSRQPWQARIRICTWDWKLQPALASEKEKLCLVEVKDTSRWSLQWLSNNPSWIDGWVEA